MIGKAARLSAEEIEMGLINPNSLAQLHIALLKVFDLFIFYICLFWGEKLHLVVCFDFLPIKFLFEKISGFNRIAPSMDCIRSWVGLM